MQNAMVSRVDFNGVDAVEVRTSEQYLTPSLLILAR
jgi:hypothetical protein